MYFRFKHSLKYFALLVSLFPAFLFAQPSDAQVIKDLSNQGVISIKLTSKNGHKQWNSDYGTWEYVRGVKEVIREYPKKKGVKIKIVGDAVYQLYGSKYKYWKFRVISNEYIGMDVPSSEELMKIVRSDLKKFVSSYWYNRIIGDIKAIYFPEDPKITWHTPNSVSFNIIAEYTALVSDIHTEDIVQTYNVRLYRESEDKPWNNFISSKLERKTSNRKEYSRSEVKQMKTLGEIDREQAAQAALSSLPQMDIPKFKSGVELVLYLHNLLLDGTPEQVEAFLMKTLAPSAFVSGSTTQLNRRGADMINNTIKNAFKKRGTYKQQYCRNPFVDKRRSSKSRIYINGCINKVSTMIAFGKFGGGYKEGVKTGGEWKITDLYVGTRQDDDAIAYINSFSNRSKLCPND